MEGMIRILAAAGLAMAGCAVDVDRHEIAPPAGASTAVAAAVESLRSQGYQVDDVEVHWSAEPIDLGDGTTAIGAHWGCGEIWITWWPGPKLSDLALAHEIAHCARTSSGMSSDRDHVDASWWARGGVVSRVQGAIAAVGL
jgi:hypothetical protein